MCAQLVRAPATQHERGVLYGTPIRRNRDCAKHRHAVRAFRAAAYVRAAAATGRGRGDLELSAAAKFLELMPIDVCGSEAERVAPHAGVP